jgi:Tol biopolymer transport system component
VWRIPITGSPADNARAAVRITRQTGVAQTPSLSPDGSEVVYLSDSGGHGNLWVARTDGSSVRQITFERDPTRSVGVPVWSPTSGQIAFIFARGGSAEQWIVNRDGTGLRKLTQGVWAHWSPDGRWLYITVSRRGRYCIDKVPVDGGSPVEVRCDNATAAAPSPDGSTLYFVTPLIVGSGGWDLEIRRARPETAASTVIARIAGSTIPTDAFNVHAIVSPDGRWLGQPLTDGTTTDFWALPTDGSAMRRLTDFGRPVTIARRFSWSPDGKSIYAAIADVDADIVLLSGLIGK